MQDHISLAPNGAIIFFEIQGVFIALLLKPIYYIGWLWDNSLIHFILNQANQIFFFLYIYRVAIGYRNRIDLSNIFDIHKNKCLFVEL